MLGKKPLKPLSILPRRLLHSCLKSHCPNFVVFFPKNIQAKLEGKLLAFRSPQHFVCLDGDELVRIFFKAFAYNGDKG